HHNIILLSSYSLIQCPTQPTRHSSDLLIEQRRRRRVDMLAGMAEADHAPRAFGNRGEAEGVVSFDVGERDTMHRGDLRGVGHEIDRKSTRMKSSHVWILIAVSVFLKIL